MSKKTVLVTDYTWPTTEPEARVLEAVGAELLIAKSGEEEELVDLVRHADGILTCFKQVTANVIRAGANARLQVIGRYGIGVDNIDIEEATKHGIPVTNVPAYCLDEVTEHCLAFMLASARSICTYNTAVREGDWNLPTGTPIYRVRGKTLGILGFGKIGSTLAAKASGFGLRIIAYDPFEEQITADPSGIESVSLEELLTQSDYVSIHAPLIPQTRGLINEERLRLMKPSAFLINAARGAIIDMDALALALKENWIAGAALDVFEPERLPVDHPLLSCPTLIATPHVAFYSEESVVDLEVLAAENVAAILTGKHPASIVNPEVLKLDRWSHLQDPG
jgi:D-3-phosphoglycerate dehydrogenase